MSSSSSCLTWECFPFSDFSPYSLYSVLQLRQLVFVIEQNCLYQDCDNFDQKCFHLLGWNKQQKPEEQNNLSLSSLVCYCRIIPAGVKYDECSIGRVIVHPDYRAQGYGRLLMKEALKIVDSSRPFSFPVRLSAQAHLQKFYSSFDFIAQGEIYLDDEIPHIDMIKREEQNDAVLVVEEK
jgi:ElaA protein